MSGASNARSAVFSRRIRRAVTFAALAPLAFVLGATGCTTPRTELLVVADTDLEWGPGKPIQSLSITVRSDGPEGTVRLEQNVTLGGTAGATMPASFGVIPLNGDAQRVVWIEVRACAAPDGCDATHALVVQRAIVGFVPRATLELQLFLAADCANVRCDDPHQVCNPTTSHCESAQVDPTTLAPYNPDAGADASDANDANDANDAGDAALGVVTQLAGGGTHVCALKDNGTVTCWGSNTLGSLGTGTATQDWPGPQQVTGVSDAVQIASGDEHTCAVKANRTVTCWGGNDLNQLGGLPAEGYSATPIIVQGIGGVVEVAAGSRFSCGRDETGNVWCWGWNHEAQLGRGTQSDDADTMPATVLNLFDAAHIIAGEAHACAIRVDGSVSCWGRNTDGQLGIGTQTPYETLPQTIPGFTALEIASFGDTTCAVRPDHTVACWGDNDFSQVGSMSTEPLTMPIAVPGVSNVAHVTVSRDNACAVLMDHTVMCWGTNLAGEQGDGTFGFDSAPATVPGLTNVASATSGSNYHCTLSLDGRRVQCWGNNARGQLGRGTVGDWTLSAFPVPGLGAVSSAAAGTYFTCALATAGGVDCVGNGATPSTFQTDMATPIANTAGATQIAAGSQHACALSSGSVACWGYDDHGQLGNGMLGMDSGTPVSVPLANATFVAAGGQFSCAITPSGTQCWGANDDGQLGFGQVSGDTPSPVVAHLTNPAVQMDLGAGHACAVESGGAIECWGYGGSGTLGDGRGMSSPLPVAVAALPSPPLEVSLGDFFSCARLMDGTVWCWGANDVGQLGNGETSESGVPVPVSGLTGVAQISAGGSHACARLNDGSVWCWGDNSDGELAVPITLYSPTPVKIDALTGSTFIAVGYGHTCGIVAGMMKCLGYDGDSQFGAVLQDALPSPQPVQGF